MFRSLSLGRVFGIPIYVHSTFFLLPLFIFFFERAGGWPTALFKVGLVVLVFGCVLLHELGHALMARYFGITTRDITLYPIGGVARLERLSEKPPEEILIALAGPAVNVVIAVLLTPVALVILMSGSLGGSAEGLISSETGAMGILQAMAFMLWASNIILFLFNLLPAFPMDGGRVLRAVLASFLDHLRATEIAARVGVVMALLLGILAFTAKTPILLLVSLFVVLAGQQELMMLRQMRSRREQYAGYPETVEEVPPVPADPSAYPAPRAMPPVSPQMSPQVVGPGTPGFSGFVWDRDFQVWVKWHNGRPVAAYWGRVE